jgi:hypothetical protein
MKVFIPARHGLGDIIYQNFIATEGRCRLSKLNAMFKAGLVDDVSLFYEVHMNPEPVINIFENLPFPVKCIPTSAVEGVNPADGDNRFPDQVGDRTNMYKVDMPAELEPIPVEFPILKPSISVPKEFILLMPFAGEHDRMLTDQSIVTCIKEISLLPVIGIGKRIPRNMATCGIRCDMDIGDTISIREAAYMIREAKLVVSSLTFVRCFSHIFDKNIIELYNGSNKNTIERTISEYNRGIYGLSSKNKWFTWPQDKGAFEIEAKRILFKETI